MRSLPSATSIPTGAWARSSGATSSRRAARDARPTGEQGNALAEDLASFFSAIKRRTYRAAARHEDRNRDLPRGGVARRDAPPGEAPLAPASKQEGKYAGKRIAAIVSGEEPPTPFRYRHLGSLATIGRNSAIISFGRIKMSGFIAWCCWGLIHTYLPIGVRRPLFVAMNWFSNYVFRSKGARLITGVEGLRIMKPRMPRKG
ncbi:MAG: hypothetical protein AAF865_02940 [Pseudomonadota bacterium]